MSDTNTITPLALTGVRVASLGGLNYRDVQIAIEDATITLRTAAGVVLGSRPDIVSVEHPGVDVWVINFADGVDPWTIAKGGCGCQGA